MVTSMDTWRCGTSSFLSAASITAYSAGVATMRIMLLSLSATTCTLRITPLPAPCAAPAPGPLALPLALPGVCASAWVCGVGVAP